MEHLRREQSQFAIAHHTDTVRRFDVSRSVIFARGGKRLDKHGCESATFAGTGCRLIVGMPESRQTRLLD